MKKEFLTGLLVVTMCLSSVACSGNKGGGSSGNGSGSGNSGSGSKESKVEDTIVNTDYFDMHKAGPNMELSGLSEKGKKQENLVIPAGAIITGTIIDGVVKNVSFESDDDMDINMLVSTSTTLETIKLPANITSLDGLAFSCCANLKEIVLPKGITVIPDLCFMSDESLKTVTIEGDVTEICSMAFYDCASLESINLPDSITTIGDSAFFGCESLSTITLPKGLKTIGSAAFITKSGIKTINVPAELELETWDSGGFIQSEARYTVKLTEGSWADIHFDEVFQGQVTKEYV